MSDMMQTGFDYGALPVELAVSLKLHEDRFIAVRNRATYEMGKEIYEAQQELANHKNGCFQSWVEHLGISYQTGYDLITIYQNAGTDIIKLFDNKKLSQTVSVMLLRSPDSVIARAIEQAEAGDKVTVADVKQWKEAAQSASQRAEEFRQESNERRKKIRELEQQVDLLKAEKPEPEVRIEAPSDYEATKERAEKMAERIQARAIRRCGELLRQIEPNYDRGNQYRQHDATVMQPTRTEAAREAGLSERQKVTGCDPRGRGSADELIREKRRAEWPFCELCYNSHPVITIDHPR